MFQYFNCEKALFRIRKTYLEPRWTWNPQDASASTPSPSCVPPIDGGCWPGYIEGKTNNQEHNYNLCVDGSHNVTYVRKGAAAFGGRPFGGRWNWHPPPMIQCIPICAGGLADHTLMLPNLVPNLILNQPRPRPKSTETNYLWSPGWLFYAFFGIPQWLLTSCWWPFGVPQLPWASPGALGNLVRHKIRLLLCLCYHFHGKGWPGVSQRYKQSPKERPKGSRGGPKGEKNQKKKNCDTLISDDSMGVWLHLHPSGGPETKKKANEIWTKKQQRIWTHKIT